MICRARSQATLQAAACPSTSSRIEVFRFRHFSLRFLTASARTLLFDLPALLLDIFCCFLFPLLSRGPKITRLFSKPSCLSWPAEHCIRGRAPGRQSGKRRETRSFLTNSSPTGPVPGNTQFPHGLFAHGRTCGNPQFPDQPFLRKTP